MNQNISSGKYSVFNVANKQIHLILILLHSIMKIISKNCII